MSGRPIRVLIAKPGLDGHDRGAKIVAAALRDRGMEVVYTGLHKTPAEIARIAVQEDVDVVGLSIHSGSHMELFPAVLRELDKAGAGGVLLVGGGIIPDEDRRALEAAGFARIFGPDTPTTEIADFIEEAVAGRRRD